MPYLFLNGNNFLQIPIARLIFLPKSYYVYLLISFLKFLSFGFCDIPHPCLFSFHCLGSLSFSESFVGSSYAFLPLCFPKLPSDHVSGDVLKGILNKNNLCHVNKWRELHRHTFFSFSPLCPLTEGQLSSTVRN